jgi:hypothetical protein
MCKEFNISKQELNKIKMIELINKKYIIHY